MHPPDHRSPLAARPGAVMWPGTHRGSAVPTCHGLQVTAPPNSHRDPGKAGLGPGLQFDLGWSLRGLSRKVRVAPFHLR